MSEIKTALERFQAYCASKGIPEKSSLAHIHKMDQFEDHERKELRAAYGQQKILIEALQKENAFVINDLHIARSHVGTLKAENAAQAKQIADLELAVKANHEWHQEHDDYDGYQESELFNANTNALSAQKGN